MLLTSLDKGTGIAIVRSDEFFRKGRLLVGDRKKFHPVSAKEDKTRSTNFFEAIKRKINTLVAKRHLHPRKAASLFPKCPETSCLYLLPKVPKGKDDLKFRLILDMTPSTQHGLVKWLKENLKPVREVLCPHSVINSTDVILD